MSRRSGWKKPGRSSNRSDAPAAARRSFDESSYPDCSLRQRSAAMSPQRSPLSQILLLGGMAAVVGWLIFSEGHAGSAGQLPTIANTTAAPPAGAAQGAQENRPADRAAIQKAVESFAAAFQKGDAKALISHWTTEGEYTSEDG